MLLVGNGARQIDGDMNMQMITATDSWNLNHGGPNDQGCGVLLLKEGAWDTVEHLINAH